MDNEKTLEVIEITEEDIIDIEVEEAFKAQGEPNEALKHTLLTERDVADQHPIEAIIGLRDELDEIESLKTVYSDKIGVATYYEWADDHKYDDFGYFVSMKQHSTMIELCKGSDIFGVTVDITLAGFVGGQTDPARGNNYGLVATTGFVDVRCESSVEEGDYVVSSELGIATKTESGCGYKVISTEIKNEIPWATISLGVQACTTSMLGAKVNNLTDRVDRMKADIANAQRTANEAYERAQGDIDNANQNIGKINESVENLNVQIGIIGEQIVDVDKILDDLNTDISETQSVITNNANDTMAKMQQLEKDVKKNAEDAAEENRSLEQYTADQFERIFTSIDKYAVGEYSQAYGLSLEQAGNILREGMIYIPLKVNGSDTHWEYYNIDGKTPHEEKFTYGWYYEWKYDASLKCMRWVEVGQHNQQSVWFDNTSPSDPYDYWYDDDGAKLFKYDNGKWVEVAILAGNANNRLVSKLHQDVNSLNFEVSSPQGSLVKTMATLENEQARINDLVGWASGDASGDFYNLADLERKADASGASVTQLVENIGGYVKQDLWIAENKHDQNIIYYAKSPSDNKNYYYYYDEDEKAWKQTTDPLEAGCQVNAASIVAAVNDSGDSAIVLDAKHINLNGAITANGNVQITTDGEIIAKAGQVGGWDITTGGLSYRGENGQFSGLITGYSSASIISQGYTSEGLVYELNDDKQSYSVKISHGYSNYILIPDTYQNLPITSIVASDIGMGVFDDICGIIMSNNITTVGEYAFYGYKKLYEVVFSNQLNTIGNYAFYGCDNLSQIVLPAATRIIGSYAFASCISVTHVALPEHLTTINEGAFQDCESLQRILIPKGVKYVGNYTFQNCSDLQQIRLESTQVPGGWGEYWNYDEDDEIEVVTGVQVTQFFPSLVNKKRGSHLRLSVGGLTDNYTGMPISEDTTGLRVLEDGSLYAQAALLGQSKDNGLLVQPDGHVIASNGHAKFHLKNNSLCIQNEYDEEDVGYQDIMVSPWGITQHGYDYESNKVNSYEVMRLDAENEEGRLYGKWYFESDDSDSKISVDSKKMDVYSSATDLNNNTTNERDVIATSSGLTINNTTTQINYGVNNILSSSQSKLTSNSLAIKDQGMSIVLAPTGIQCVQHSETGDANVYPIEVDGVGNVSFSGNKIYIGPDFVHRLQFDGDEFMVTLSDASKFSIDKYGLARTTTKGSVKINNDCNLIMEHKGDTLDSTTTLQPSGFTLNWKAYQPDGTFIPGGSTPISFGIGETTNNYLRGNWFLNDSSVAVTSWRGAKNNIEPLSEKYSILFDNLRPSRFTYNEGTSKRYHTGFVLDELKDAIDTAGLDTQEVAAYCITDEETGNGGIRYEELIPLCVNEIQKLKARIDELEAKLADTNNTK